MITAVERLKRSANRYNIYINGAFAFSAHEDIVVRFRLLKGAVLTGRTCATAMREEQHHGAYRAALQYIGRAMKTEKEIADYLMNKGYDADTAAETVRKLAERKWVDDGEYASMLARQRLRLNRKGTLWIKRELAQKGVDRRQIEAALDQFDGDAEFEQAWKLAVGRWERDKDGDRRKKMRRLAGLLVRRGFTRETVSAVLAKLGDPYESEWVEEE